MGASATFEMVVRGLVLLATFVGARSTSCTCSTCGMSAGPIDYQGVTYNGNTCWTSDPRTGAVTQSACSDGKGTWCPSASGACPVCSGCVVQGDEKSEHTQHAYT